MQTRFFDAPRTPINGEGLIERLAIVHFQYRYHFHRCGYPIQNWLPNVQQNTRNPPTDLGPIFAGFCAIMLHIARRDLRCYPAGTCLCATRHDTFLIWFLSCPRLFIRCRDEDNYCFVQWTKLVSALRDTTDPSTVKRQRDRFSMRSINRRIYSGENSRALSDHTYGGSNRFFHMIFYCGVCARFRDCRIRKTPEAFLRSPRVVSVRYWVDAGGRRDPPVLSEDTFENFPYLRSRNNNSILEDEGFNSSARATIMFMIFLFYFCESCMYSHYVNNKISKSCIRFDKRYVCRILLWTIVM